MLCAMRLSQFREDVVIVLRKENAMENIKKNYKRLYEIWQGMNKRCNNKNCKDYYNYGGRGISICDEWNNSSENFISWALSNGYSDELSIDRINTNSNYCPQNCKWSTPTEQVRNRHLQRNNKTGYTGVRKVEDKFRAWIIVKNKPISLGTYSDIESAVNARKSGEAKYWGKTG